MTYTGAWLCLEPRQQAAWEEQAFLTASSRLWWSANLFSSCRLSSGFPQGQGWATAIGCPGAFWAWVRQVYNLLVLGMHPRRAHPAIAPMRAGANHTSYKQRGRKVAASAAAEPVLSCTAACLTVPSRRQRGFFFWVLAPTSKSLGPAADRQRTARPASESRIHAFAALFTETLLPPVLGLSPPLSMVKIEFPFTAEPPPGLLLVPFPS